MPLTIKRITDLVVGVLSWIKSLTASPQPKKNEKEKNYLKKDVLAREIIKKRTLIALNLDQTENLLHLRIQEGLQSLQIRNQKLTLEQKIREKKLNQENLG